MSPYCYIPLVKGFLPFLSVFWLGCAEVKGYLGGAPASPPAELTYADLPLHKVLDPAQEGPPRVRTTVEYRGSEDTLLDLPDDFHRGWVRISVSEPGKPGVKTSNVVVGEDKRDFLKELRPGQRFELSALRIRADDVGFTEGGPAVVLQAVQLNKAGARKAAVASAASEFPPGSLYRNNRSADEFIFLGADGRFRLRDRGRELAGLYERKGKAVTLKLPDGHGAQAVAEGSMLKDPEGREWRLSEE